MPVIHQSVVIDANIEAVFDLISRIEEFPRYADVLKEVRQIGPGLYRWTAQAFGMTLNWDSVITDCVRPTHIAWRSVKGFANSGAYSLASTPHGTKVSITIEYSFPNQLIATLLTPLVAPLVHSSAGDILRRVKQQLEGGHFVGDGKRPRRKALPGKRIGALLTKVRKMPGGKDESTSE